jgi:hypothetical protein
MTTDPEILFSSLYCGAIALQTCLHFREQLLFLRSDPQRLYGPPPLLLGYFRLPQPGERAFLLSGGLYIAFLAAASARFMPRMSLALALVCSLLYLPPILPLGYLGRKGNLIPIVLTALIAWPSHALLLVQAAIAMVYFSAGIEKLLATGPGWADGKTFLAYLIRHHLFTGNRGALWLIERPRLCMCFSIFALAWELTFWVVMIYPPAAWFYVTAGIFFHAGTSLLMRIHYWIYFGPVYFVFITPWLCSRF